MKSTITAVPAPTISKQTLLRINYRTLDAAGIKCARIKAILLADDGMLVTVGDLATTIRELVN